VIAHFHHCIEQLDLAAKQFDRASSAYARFALILTDNVLELMLHRFAEQELKWDEMWRSLGKQKYSDDERTRVLGQHFEEKPKFARKLGVLSDDEMTFVLICHRYRNELYHRGIVHESVIFDIAWQYHDVVCDLMPRLQKGSYRWRMGESISAVVKTYCGEEGLARDPDRRLPEVAKQLANAKPSTARPLAAALSEAAVERLEQLDGDIEFLMRDSPIKRTREDAIFDVQAWPFLLSDESKHSIQLNSGEEIQSFQHAFNLLRERWKPPISNDPVPRWKDRATQLRHEVSALKALEKYQQLMDQMDDFDEKVRDAAVALDQHIQQEIDLRRGK
jgi:hypothetical protein